MAGAVRRRGDFNVASGATLDFRSDFTLAPVPMWPGRARSDFSTGTVTIGGSFAASAVTVDGGTANFNVVPSGLQSLTISAGDRQTSTRPILNLTTLTISERHFEREQHHQLPGSADLDGRDDERKRSDQCQWRALDERAQA